MRIRSPCQGDFFIYAAFKIESGCTRTLTGDCKISSLANGGTINSDGHTITLADGTVLK